MSLIKKIGKKVILCLLILQTLGSKSQNIDFRQFTSANGLLSDKVYNIYQDKRGYLWIFSEYGTLKYDGEEFHRVLKNLPLSESFIYSIYERADGRIWIANARANVYEVVNDSAFKLQGFEETSEILRRNVSEIVKIAVNESDEIYLITKASSYLLRPNNGIFLSENLTNKIVDDSVKIQLYAVKDELLPVHTRKENDEYLSLWKSKLRYISFDGSKRNVRIRYDPYTVPFRHFRKKGDKIYYTKASTIGVINADNSTYELDLKYTVLNFRFDRNGHTWIGLLNGGLCELNERDSVVGRYLNGITVDDIEVDFQNGIWASTAGEGLFRFNNRVLKDFSDISQGTSIIFIKQCGTNVLIANAHGELFWKSAQGTDKIKSSGAEDIVSAAERNGIMYLSFPHRIEKISVRNNKIKNEVYLSKSPKLLQVEILKGDTLVGIWRRGLAILYDHKNQKFVDFGCKVTCFGILNDTLWYGTEKGIYYRKLSAIAKSEHVDFEAIARKEEPITTDELRQFENSYVSSILIDDKNRIWFATKGQGLYLKEGSKVHSIAIPQIEFVNALKIHRNKILLCANNGAYISSAMHFGELDIKWYKIEDREIQQAFSINDDLYLLGSGMIFSAKQAIGDSIGSRLIFRCRGLNAGISFMPANTKFSVQHKYENLSFTFDRITYSTQLPDLNYEITGAVNQKGVSKTNAIELSRLPVGKYTIKVYPNIYEGAKLAIVLSLEILPEWYETWLMKLVSVSALLTAIITLVILIINRNKKKDRLQNEQEQLLLEYKLIALKAQVNPHFISNCLTAIQNLVVKGESEKANIYVARFGLLVRKILDYSSIPLITLEEELEIVKLYIQMEEVRFGRIFSFSLYISNDIDKHDVLVPSLLLNPIIENAIWHGLLPKATQQNLQLDITIRKTADVLQIKILDNGVGLTNNRDEELKRKSYGLDITMQRIKNINFLLQRDTGKVEIYDRKNLDSDNTGVEVIIWVPLENKY